MVVGASTSCLFPMLTERALDDILGMGVKNIEVFLNSPSERTAQFARKLKKSADENGAKIISVHPYNSESEGVSFFGRYERRFSDETEDFKKYLDFCNTVGADILVFHGARSFLPIRRELYFERFAALHELCKSFNVRLCQENVARCVSGSVDFISEMASALPQAEFVLDIKQAKRAGVSPFEMLEAMGTSLAHLHLSDHDGERDCVVPGKGSFDLKRLAERLKQNNFGGAVLVELYSWNFDDEKEIKEAIELFSSFL